MNLRYSTKSLLTVLFRYVIGCTIVSVCLIVLRFYNLEITIDDLIFRFLVPRIIRLGLSPWMFYFRLESLDVPFGSRFVRVFSVQFTNPFVLGNTWTNYWSYKSNFPF